MLVIGAGASGLTCAVWGVLSGSKVILLDGNEKCGKKIYITGKGRCNVTNACLNKEFFENVVSNPKFLYSALNAYDSRKVMDFFTQNGVPLKIERGNRVFPESDKASDITHALEKCFLRNGGELKLGEKVLKVEKTGKGFIVKTNKGEYSSQTVVICTGGVSYPSTGSTGDGYNFARHFGHSIVNPVPALSALYAKDTYELAGLSLKNVSVSVFEKGKKLCSDFGEMLFTHNGVSGPCILTLSSNINRMDVNGLELQIDLKPALDEEKLDLRLLRDFSDNTNKTIANVLPLLMPKALIPIVLRRADINGNTKINSITKEQRLCLVRTIKGLSFPLKSFAPIGEAIVTAGGISVKEINPRTMESKLVEGLFFAGEIIDVDCYTGGFNLQTAFSTGYIAGISASKKEEEILG